MTVRVSALAMLATPWVSRSVSEPGLHLASGQENPRIRLFKEYPRAVSPEVRKTAETPADAPDQPPATNAAGAFTGTAKTEVPHLGV
jgi:hypothetical protein